MSLSVDDLVASLSANHIGQEAIDLAALQAQLAQTLCQTLSHARTIPRRGYIQPSTTPVARTPSCSISWDPSEGSSGWARPSNVASTPRSKSMDGRERDVDDMEDERMVEDLLLPSPSTSSHFTFAHPHLHPGSPVAMSPMASHDEMSYDLASPSSSMFASTDPFFIAQLQQANQTPANSFFAQAGRPTQQSPFVTPQSKTAFGHPFAYHGGMSTEVDPHTMLVASTGF